MFPCRYYRRQTSGILLPPSLCGAVCHDFLWNVFPQLLKIVDLHTSIHLWYTYDFANPNFLLAGREFFRNVQQCRWESVPTAVSSSQSLKSLRFLSLGISEDCCFFATDDTDLQDLQWPIPNVFLMIRTTPGIFQRVRQSPIRRATSCFQAEGRHIIKYFYTFHFSGNCSIMVRMDRNR